MDSESQRKRLVQNSPVVDPNNSYITWVPEYDDQPLFYDNEFFECRVTLKDVHGNNYEGEFQCDSLIVETCEEMPAQIIMQLDNNGSQIKVVVLLRSVFFENVISEPKFWFFFDGEKITRPLLLQFDDVKEYNDKLVTVRESDGVIRCCGVTTRDIIGPDHSQINNIKRICELDEYPKIKKCGDEVVIQLSEDENIDKKTRMFYKMLLHLLKALYYREQAFEADKKREHWKEMATQSYDMNNRAESRDWYRPSFCSRIKEKYATIMNEYHEKACDEFFTFFNTKRSQSEIDLHGLLVADENKLKKYERQLRKKNSNAETKAKVQEEREKGDEAIRKLEKRLDGYIKKAREDKETWLEIIVGAGRHSKDRQVIRPKVEKYLRERNLRERNLEFKRINIVNKGALVVTYEEYKGSEPCFGEYYCERCDHTWRSRRSWVGKWQACYKCYKKNYKVKECDPLKQREVRKWPPYKQTGARTGEEIQHLPELCQKCKELGCECPPQSTEEIIIYD